MNRRRYALIAALAAVLLLFCFWMIRLAHSKSSSTGTEAAPAAGSVSPNRPPQPGLTTVYAHNLELRKGPDFRIYVRWLRGEMVPSHPGQAPSLDDEESFVFRIDGGLIHANIGDIEKYLNAKVASQSPFKNMKLSGTGSELKLSGTLHKFLVPLPVELTGTLAPAPSGRIHFTVSKINVLKIPMKALLGGLKLEVKDIVGPNPIPGFEVTDNEIYLDTTHLLPPPHIRGQMSGIRVQIPDIEVTYGNTTPDDEAELAQWHNFLRLRGGVVEFGKLTMQDADLTLIDASDDVWFDLDLANYQSQVVKGYSRMTPAKGLEIFMPDVGKEMPAGAVSLDTLKNRNRPLPNLTPKR
jgi:hypothetical protein